MYRRARDLSAVSDGSDVDVVLSDFVAEIGDACVVDTVCAGTVQEAGTEEG